MGLLRQQLCGCGAPLSAAADRPCTVFEQRFVGQMWFDSALHYLASGFTTKEDYDVRECDCVRAYESESK